LILLADRLGHAEVFTFAPMLNEVAPMKHTKVLS